MLGVAKNVRDLRDHAYINNRVSVALTKRSRRRNNHMVGRDEVDVKRPLVLERTPNQRAMADTTHTSC